VTFLAILANQAIALPLSPAFPNHELEYILNDSAAKLVLASPKHEGKAQELLKGNIDAAPIYTQIHKILDAKSSNDVEFQDMPEDVGGMMLYTSGTTAKPVRREQKTPFPDES
jgi:malonyl-CoA/methylmalonyl-CoA synthetase